MAVLLHEPDVDPRRAYRRLDPNQIHEVRGTIRKLGGKDGPPFPHILQEVEAMANRVLFINEGQLIFDGDQGADQRTAVRWTSISAS